MKESPSSNERTRRDVTCNSIELICKKNKIFYFHFTSNLNQTAVCIYKTLIRLIGSQTAASKIYEAEGAGPETQTKCLSLVPLKVGGIRHLPGWMDGWMHRGSTDHRSVRCEGRNDEPINPCHPAIFSQR